MATMSARDKKYQAEEDARTLTRAMEISRDKARYTACLKGLREQKIATDDALSLLKSPRQMIEKGLKEQSK